MPEIQFITTGKQGFAVNNSIIQFYNKKTMSISNNVLLIMILFTHTHTHTY